MPHECRPARNSKRRGLSDVGHVGLVCDAKQENAGIAKWYAELGENVNGALDDMMGPVGNASHDLVEEGCCDAKGLELPSEVMGIAGDAVSPYARPRVEGHIAVGLGCRSRYCLHDVNAERSCGDRELVGKGNVGRWKVFSISLVSSAVSGSETTCTCEPAPSKSSAALRVPWRRAADNPGDHLAIVGYSGIYALRAEGHV